MRKTVARVRVDGQDRQFELMNNKRKRTAPHPPTILEQIWKMNRKMMTCSVNSASNFQSLSLSLQV